ncbi:hypothetical protein [Streptomyces sp. NPDC055013]
MSKTPPLDREAKRRLAVIRHVEEVSGNVAGRHLTSDAGDFDAGHLALLLGFEPEGDKARLAVLQ